MPVPVPVPTLKPDEAAFPVAPPPDLRDDAAIAAHDWAAFSALDAVGSHWARPAWPDGARAYYWMLTFTDEPELGALARRCQKELGELRLDPVPAEDGLHITLGRVGAPEPVTPRQLDALARAVPAAAGFAFALRVMPLAGSRGAVRCSVARGSR